MERDGSAKLLSWVVVLGALFAFVVYVLVRFYSVSPLFLNSSMVSAIAALVCVVLSTFLWPRLFAFQFMVLCRPLPGARQLLADSEQLLIAEEDFYSVLQPHVTRDDSEYAKQATRTRDAVNQDWA